MNVAQLSILLQARDQASQALKNVKGGLGKIATAAKVAATAGAAALVGFGVAAIKAAADFETGMREVNTLIGLNEKDFKGLSAATVDLSKRLGVEAVSASKALYQAISAGVPKENAISFMEVASKAAIGGVTDITTAVDGLTTVLNAFQMDASEADKVADIMFTTVKQGKTDFSQLSSSIFNVAPIAKTAGVAFEEVSAAIATVTKQGVPTSVATTQIRAAIQGLLKPSEDMTGIFNKLGFESAGAAIKSKGLQFALDAVREATGGDVGELQKLLGSVEGVSAALGITGDNAAMFEGDLEAMRNAAGASTAAFEEMNKSFGRQMETVKARLQAVLITVGSKLLPLITPIISAIAERLPAAFDAAEKAIGPVVDAIERVIDVGQMVASVFQDTEGAGLKLHNTLENMVGLDVANFLILIVQGAQALASAIQSLVPEPVQTFVANLMAAAQEGDLLGKVLSIVSGVISAMARGIVELTSFIEGNKAAQAALVGILTSAATAWTVLKAVSLGHVAVMGIQAAATGVLTAAQTALNIALTANPIGLIVVALAGLVAGLIYAYNTSEDFRNVVDGAFKAVTDAFNAFRNAAESVWSWLERNIPKAGEWISETWNSAQSAVQNAVSGIFNWIQEKFNDALNLVKSVQDGIRDKVNEVWNAIPADIRADLDLIAGHLKTKFEAFIADIGTWLGTISTTISTAWTNISTAAGTAWEGIKGVISGWLTDIRDNVVTPIVDGIRSVLDTAWTAISGAVETAWEAVKTTISGKLDDATGALSVVSKFVGDLLAKLGQLATDALKLAGDIGNAIIEGIKTGINNQWQFLMNLVGDLARAALNAAKAALGISSPSKEFFRIGEQMMQGLINGLKARNTNLIDWIRTALGDSIKLVESLTERIIGGPNGAILSRGASAVGALQKAIADRGPIASMYGIFSKLTPAFEQITKRSGDMELFGQIKDAIGAMREMGMTIDDEVIAQFKDLAQYMDGPVKDMLDKFISSLPQQDALAGLKELLGEADLARQIASTASLLQSLGQTMPESLRTMLEQVLATAEPGGILATIIEQILNGIIPGYQTGTNYVPRTGIYQLHQGEQVIPAGQQGGNTYVYSPTIYSNAAAHDPLMGFSEMKAVFGS